ncbi:5169_t:CDS:2 [Racocetra fulgida]|uniref:threonine--tRNA ligase n=1 Tax=Racocetra fulgida TaxID=60492 RepID=A0A9N9F312_9GLOM|nr:5169_t:CDS:2 [Racocetra fulgida]
MSDTNQVRDHRKIAQELDLYILDERAGQVIIRNQIQKFLQQKQKKFGFQEVITPILGSEYLYETSGHLQHYRDYMFPSFGRDNETFRLRPMTCPHHCLIYRQKPRSYRDLPWRLCENSFLYRYEASGALKETLLKEALTELGLNYIVLKGEAAFYGPKLDLEIEAADGKNITIATIQLDFVLPLKFNLKYINKRQELITPVIIHQSPIGTYQRFIALLLEKTDGRLPF